MDMSFEALVSNQMEIENEDFSGTRGVFESFTSAESLEVCRLLGLNAHGDMMPESSSRNKITPEKTSATPNRVVAERKRREQLSERFISLASLIPGLKKMDKASILENAIKHMAELNETIKSLECCLKKESDDIDEDDETRTTKTTTTTTPRENMEMKLKETNKNILIRIYCDGKDDDIGSKVLSYLKTLQLTILNTWFLPFGQHAFDITILVKRMENSNYDISMQELEQKLGEIIRAIV